MALIPVQRSDGTYGYIAPDKQFYTEEEAFAKFPTTPVPQEKGLSDQIQQVANEAIQAIKDAGNSAINATYDYFANTNADYNATLVNNARAIGDNVMNLFQSDSATQKAANDAVNKVENRPDWDALNSDSPFTWRELHKPEVMAVAHDDIPKMSAVETIANTLAKSYQLGDDMSQLSELSRKLKKNNQSMEDAADEDREQMLALQKHIAELQKDLPTSPWSPSGLVSTLTQMVPTVVNGAGTIAKRTTQYATIGGTAGTALAGLGMVPGMVAGGFAGFGAGIAEEMAHQEEGMTYLQGLQSGSTKQQARRGANISYMGNYLFNAPVWGGLFNPLKVAASTGLLKQLGVETLENSFLGALGAASSVAGRNIATNTDWTLKDVGEMLSGGIDSIPVTLALGGPKYGFAALHKLGKAVDASKVTTRDPDMMANHVNTIVKDTPMDGVSFDASQLADDIGNMTVEEGTKTAQRLKIDNEDFAAQVATGGDVTVSTGDFVVLPEETRNKLLADARVAGDESAREQQTAWEAEQAKKKTETKSEDATQQNEDVDQNVLAQDETPKADTSIKVEDTSKEKDNLEANKEETEKPLDYQEDLRGNEEYDKAVTESKQEQPITPEQTKAEQEYIKTRTAEIEKEVDAEPVYAASKELVDEKIYDDAAKEWDKVIMVSLDGTPPPKKPAFNLQLFAKQIREGRLSDALMNQIEALAERHGFTSADHLAQAILKSKPRDEEIRNRVAQATKAIQDVVGTSEEARQAKSTINEGSLKKTAMELSSMAESIVNGVKKEAKENPIRGKKDAGKRFTAEGAKVYKEALKTFQSGNKALSQAAKDNAFIYARIADRWAEVMRQYGKKDYTAADFAKAHPIVIGGETEKGQLTQMAGTKSQTAAMDKLSEAQRRIDAGEDKQKVYEETGWFKGKDNRWRYEIPDDLDAIHLPESEKKATLGEVYQNARLYEAYPELQHISVAIEKIDDANGYYDLDDNVIALSDTLSAEQAKSTLIHEVQHAIQFIEGFSSGGSPRSVKGQIQKRINMLEQSVHDISDHGKAYFNAVNDMEQGMIFGDMKKMQEAKARKESIEEHIPEADRQTILRRLREAERLKKELTATDKDAYWRLHGEQEARQTANRAAAPFLSAKIIPAYETTMAAKDAPIIVFDGQVFEQRAWHGSPYDFDSFDLGAIGSGTGEQAHGWGLYFAKNKKIADEYKAVLSGTKGDGLKATIYEVEVPEDTVLLNEELEFSEQPRKVKAAIRKIVKNLTDEELENAGEDVSWEGRATARRNVLALLNDLDGQDIYNTLYDIVGGDKEASLRLNEYGIKGITYNERDGQCFVVFDDKAIQVIDKYNQQHNVTRGAYDTSTGAVHLFESANQSTFIHESAHMWLSEMESLSMQENAPKDIIRDFATLKDWMQYRPEQVSEYTGELGKEFSGYAKAIEEARKSGDTIAIKAAEERWMQERFARGFERYLAEGKAPTKELKGVFERFKQWLIGIYQDLKELGKEPPPEIQRIMDKMLTSEDANTQPRRNKRIERLKAQLDEAKKQLKATERWKDAEAKLVTNIEVGKAKAKGKRALEKAKAQMAKSMAEQKAKAQERVRKLQEQYNREISALKGERNWYAAEAKDYRAKRIARNSEYSVTRAKQVARDLIAKVPVRQAADWRNYSKLAKKCRDISERAYRKGDYQTALTWKNKEVINHAMAMEALKYEKQFLKGTQFLRKLQKLDKQKFNTQEDFDQVGSLLERFGVERPDYNRTAKQETLAQWAERNQSLMGNVSIDDWLLDESIRKDYGELMPDDFDSLIKALRNMRTVSNFAKKTMAVEKGVDIYNLQQFIIEELSGGTHKNKDAKTWKDAFIAGVTDLKNMDTWLTNLVGENSTLYQVLCNNVWDAYNQESRMVRRLKEGYDKIWGVYSHKERKAMQKPIYVEDMGVSVTKQNMIGVAMNLGTEGNMTKLLSAVPVDFEGAVKWDIQSITKMLAENLTEKDWKAVQGTWDLLETMWPELAENHKKFVGFVPDKISPQALDVKTADGKTLHLRGGYAPLKVDRRASLVSGDAMDANAPLYSNQSSPMILATKKGFTKSRTNAAYTVDLDPDVITQHLLDVAHDICFRGIVSDMNRIFNKDVRQALKNKTGDVGVQYLDDYLKELVGTPYRDKGFDGVNIALRWMRKAATTSAISLRPGVIIQNFANVGLYANAVKGWGHLDVINALIKQGVCNYWVKSAFNWRKARMLDEQIYNLSPYMYDRKGRPDYALRELQGGVFGDQYNGVRDKIAEFASNLMMVTDDLTAKPMWLGAYEKEFRRTGDQRAAVAYADSLIRRTIGSGRRIDQSPFMRADPISVKGSMNIFYGFFNNEFNRWSREFHIAQQSILNVPGFLAFIAGRAIVFNLGGLLLAGQGPDKDESWLSWSTRNTLKYPISLVPGLRDVLPGGIDSMFGRQTFGYKASVINSGLSTAYTLFDKTGKLVSGDGKTKKTARQKANQKQSLAETTAKLASFAARYPDQFNAWFFNAYDYWANSMKFEPGDLIRRRPYNERVQNKKKG